MLVSVIIPAYNRETTIRRAVDSVLSQTYLQIEVIVVDDGSTDSTVAALSGYDARVRVICQKNAGPSAARNAGIRASHGAIIAFLDSDDEWLPSKLDHQIKLMTGEFGANVACCICNATMLYADGTSRTSFQAAGLEPRHRNGIWLNPSEVLLTRFVLFNQVAAVRRDTLDRVGYFPDKLRIMEDYDLALRLAAAGPWAYTTDSLVVWHGGAENSLSSSVRHNEIPALTHQILTRFCATPLGHSTRNMPLMKRRLFVLQNRAKAIDTIREGSGWSRVVARFDLQYLRLYEAVFN
ncbi:MAG: glycosyltransferase family A protein [Opitutus sp.]